jgi:hypothetical protein
MERVRQRPTTFMRARNQASEVEDASKLMATPPLVKEKSVSRSWIPCAFLARVPALLVEEVGETCASGNKHALREILRDRSCANLTA